MQEPIEFAAVAPQLAARGWRPFPGYQETKVPAMRGWPGLNKAEWDCADLAATVAEYASFVRRSPRDWTPILLPRWP
jgi:hypothetical protein